MGLLVDGKWVDQWYDTKKSGGEFQRQASSWRNFVTETGDAGPTGDAGFKAESGRYHLYVSLACPWAHRALIFRKIKGLESHISVDVVHPFMREHGWTFARDYDGATGDSLHNHDYMHQVYTSDTKAATTRVTVPVLWDKKTQRIVSNESSEIIEMLNSAFDKVGANENDFFPEAHRNIMKPWDDLIYDTVNNGVYKSGFATTQDAYNRNVTALTDTLHKLNAHLETHRYLCGDHITASDWRLFTTLIRYDIVYHGHFKCNLVRISDLDALFAYTRELYQWPGIRDTVNFDHIKYHYYASHNNINPTGIVPEGPIINWEAPHHRDN